jgi:hypothetical protein
MSSIDFNRVMQDSEGIYFEKTDEKHKVLAKVRPSEMGFMKEESWTVYVYKNIQSPESLTDEQVFFEMKLKFAFPKDEKKKWKYQYFYRARSGRIMLRDFESGIASEVSINSELVTRGKAKKLPQNSRIPKTAPIFRLSSSGELEREIQESSIW